MSAADGPPATPGGESAAAADGLDELTARLSEIKVTVDVADDDAGSGSDDDEFDAARAAQRKADNAALPVRCVLPAVERGRRGVRFCATCCCSVDVGGVVN